MSEQADSFTVPDAAFDLSDRREQARTAPPRPRRKPEAEVVIETINLICSLPMGYAHKVHGGAMSQTGEPDIDGCLRGRALKAEAKAGSERPTAAQMAAMRRWSGTGALVWWFRDTQHTLDVLDHIGDPGFVPDLSQPGCSCSRHRRVA